MVLKSDQERIKALLKDTITLLCRNGLTFKTEFSIEALIGITLDQDDVLLVNINEIVRNELGAKLNAARQQEEAGGNDWSDDYSGEDSGTPSPSNSGGRKRRRKRRRSSGQGSKGDDQESDGGGGDIGSGNSITGADDGSLTEPPNKRSITSRMKDLVKQEQDDDDKDIVFIKEEMDSGDWGSSSQAPDNFPSDLSAIPSSSGTSQQQQENFDFLQGNTLVPMGGSSQQNASMWADMTGRQNIMSPASKRTSAVNPNPGAPMGDESQQSLTPESLKRNAGLVEQILGTFGGHFSGLSPTGLHNIPCQSASSGQKSSSCIDSTDLDKTTDVHHVSNDECNSVDQGTNANDSFSEDIKEEPMDNLDHTPDNFVYDDPQGGITHVASNVEVQHVNETPFPNIIERLNESQELEQETFAGVRLPSRREFSDSKMKANCPVCDKIFSTYQGYMRHINQHRGRFAFHCTICNRGFMTKDHLGNHLRGHTGEKIYCYCGLGFKSHQALRTHKKREHSQISFS